MTRGTWGSWRDRLTLGPWRRRRSLDAELAALVRLDPGESHTPLSRREQRRLELARSRRSGRSGPGYARGWATILVTALLVGAVVSVVPPDGLDRLLVGVSGGPAPSTSGGAYAFMATLPGGGPVTYDPCEDIDVVVNPDGGPDDATAMVSSAVATIAEATGLTMTVTGETDERPADSRPTHDLPRYGLGYSPVLVAWSDPEETPDLAGDTAGLGGSVRITQTFGDAAYVTGQVALDGPAFRRIVAQPGGEDLARAIVVHELGHVVGLAHVDSEHELMHGDNVGLTELGSGDLAGLRAVGGTC